MSSSNVDEFSLLDNDNDNIYAQNLRKIKEDIYDISFKVKKEIDKGVEPKEFEKLNALYEATQLADEIIDSL